MALTITIPGAVEATIGATAPAVLTVGVGTPGATGPAGPGVPVGGTAGQVLQKLSGVSYDTGWATPSADFITSVTAPLAVATGNLTVDLSAYLPLSGGSLDANSTITASTATVNSLFAGDAFGVELTANPSENASLQYNGVQVQNAIGTMSVTSSGLTFPNSSTQTIAFPGFNNTALTGSPTAPTATFGDDDTSISTTAFVQAALAGGTAIARNLEVQVRNQSGSTIPAGSIVYISGATGNLPLITLAQANNDANSAQTMGFTATAIANNGTGYVIVRGELENIDTSALTEGVQLYLSPTTAGTWTTTKPFAPQHLVYVGIVIRSHPTLGTILVAVQNGYELDELHDVSAQTPADLDLLSYESSTSLWKNKTFSALGLLTSANASTTYAPKASPALTGNVTITSNSTGAALFIEQAGTGNILTLHDQATDTNFIAIDANGKINTITADATTAGLNIPHTATAPTSPVNGDIWTTTAGVFARINAGTKQLMNLGDTQTVSGSITFSNASQTLGNSTATGTINVASGATISASTKAVNIATGGVVGSTTTTILGPVLGASTTTIGGTTAASTLNLATGATLTATTKAVNIGTGGVAGSTTNIAIGSTAGTSTTTMQGTTAFTGPITGAINNISLGSGTAAQVMDFATGVTATGLTKAVSIGTNGAAGSTTTIAIGGTAGTSTTTLQGITNGVTKAVDTNNTELATTAFVVGQAGSATPLVNGTAAVGTSLRYSRQDHVHGTDTTRAPLASPTFTGTPLSTTAAVDTNTTQIATTAYVVGQGYAKLASPTFTGTPTLPTGTIATTQTAGNNTTAVATTAFVTAAVPAFATNTQAITGTSTTTVLNPSVLNQVVMYPGYRAFNSIMGNYSQTVSGTAGISVYTDYVSPYVNVANGKIMFNPSSGANVQAQSRGVGELVFDWTKPVWIAGRFGYSGSLNGDTSTTVRVTLGKTASTFGDLSTKGIGWKVLGGTASNITLMVHNGTTLTTVSTGITLSSTAVFPATTAFADWAIYSDGAGNVTMYLNGTSYATTSAGPSSGTSSQIRYAFETDNGGAPNAFCAPIHGGIKMLN